MGGSDIRKSIRPSLCYGDYMVVLVSEFPAWDARLSRCSQINLDTTEMTGRSVQENDLSGCPRLRDDSSLPCSTGLRPLTRLLRIGSSPLSGVFVLGLLICIVIRRLRRPSFGVVLVVSALTYPNRFGIVLSVPLVPSLLVGSHLLWCSLLARRQLVGCPGSTQPHVVHVAQAFTLDVISITGDYGACYTSHIEVPSRSCPRLLTQRGGFC